MQNHTCAPKPHLSNIPNELKAQPYWRPWFYSPPNQTNGKPGKTPLSAITLLPSNDTKSFSDCTTFEILEAMLLKEQEKPFEEQRFHGLGYSLHDDCHVIDLDHAIDQDGNITPMALDLLENIPGYVERSVSGSGLHIFTKLDGYESNIIQNSLNLEIYTNKRFIAVTGDIDKKYSRDIPKSAVSAAPLQKYTSEAPKENKEFAKNPDPKWSLQRIENEILAYLPTELDYNEWIQLGMGLHFQSGGSQEGFNVFDEFSANADNYPQLNEPSTWDKWKSFGAAKNPVTIGTLLHLKNKYLERSKYKAPTSDKPLLSKLKDARLELKKTDWLVDGMIKSGSLVMFAGAPSGGKTYLAIELLMSVSTGKPFLDSHLTKQGDVVFIACEGRDSVLRRVSAWVNAKNNFQDVENAYISRGEMVVTLPDAAEASSASMAKFIVENNISPKLIVIDTMNYSLGSAKENDVNDMTDYFRTLSNNLIRKFGATVLLIHHTSKDNSDIRGSSSIRGALDSLFLVSQPQPNLFKVVNDKHKDREVIPSFHLEGRSIQIDLPDGNIESNLVLYPSNIQDSPSGLSPNQQKLLELLEAKGGTNIPHKKKELLGLIGLSNYRNSARDIFKPLEGRGFIKNEKSTVTLIKPRDIFD